MLQIRLNQVFDGLSQSQPEPVLEKNTKSVANVFTSCVSQLPRSKEESSIEEISISVPAGGVFTQLPKHPAGKFENLSLRVETFKTLQSRLEDAKNNQRKEQAIAWASIAVAVGLIAVTVLFCPPAAIVWITSIHLLLFIASLSSFLLGRKESLEKETKELQPILKNDLLEAGRYLKQHSPAIRAKLEADIQKMEDRLNKEEKTAAKDDLQNLKEDLKKAQFLLKELNEKGLPMVESMMKAGIVLD